MVFDDMTLSVLPPCTCAGYDYWTGGLNPGLLWIWANSARPVVPKDSTRPEDQVTGSGRCLRLTPNAASKVYMYSGAECSNRHRYVCKHEENTTDKALTRIHKALKGDGRQSQQLRTTLIPTASVQSQLCTLPMYFYPICVVECAPYILSNSRLVFLILSTVVKSQ